MSILTPTRTKRVLWRPSDQLWAVASREWAASGYGSISQLVDAIRAANPAIVNWYDLAPGSQILVPSPGGPGR